MARTDARDRRLPRALRLFLDHVPILSLPLAADTLRRAAARGSRERAAIVGAVVLSWLLMEPQQVGTLVPIAMHFLGVLLLCALALATLARQTAATRLTLPSTRARTSQ